MSRGLGEPCPTCGRPLPLSKNEHLRRWRERHPEQKKKVSEYNRWYYQNVRKPKQQAARIDGGVCDE